MLGIFGRVVVCLLTLLIGLGLLAAALIFGFLTLTAIIWIPIVIAGLIFFMVGLILLMIILGAPLAILFLILKGARWLEKEIKKQKRGGEKKSRRA